MPAKKRVIKTNQAKRPRKKKADNLLAVQELRDAVERLPDIPLPGAPLDLPKDLPEANPSREPALIPKTGVWVAVLLTFAVIAGAWAFTLKDIFNTPFSGPKLGDDLSELKEEWKNATEDLKAMFEEMNARLKVAGATSSLEMEAALQAAAARVIFEASMASGTATSTK